MQTINQPRKIRVTGCANCPYHNATEKDNGTMHHCTHCSFIGILPIIDRKYIDNLINSQSDMIHDEYFPDWCPLEIDKYIVIQHSSPCNL